jgi:hypothetical protein
LNSWQIEKVCGRVFCLARKTSPCERNTQSKAVADHANKDFLFGVSQFNAIQDNAALRSVSHASRD